MGRRGIGLPEFLGLGLCCDGDRLGRNGQRQRIGTGCAGVVALRLNAGGDGISPRIDGQAATAGSPGIGIINCSAVRLVVYQRDRGRGDTGRCPGVLRIFSCIGSPCDGGRGRGDGNGHRLGGDVVVVGLIALHHIVNGVVPGTDAGGDGFGIWTILCCAVLHGAAHRDGACRDKRPLPAVVGQICGRRGRGVGRVNAVDRDREWLANLPVPIHGDGTGVGIFARIKIGEGERVVVHTGDDLVVLLPSIGCIAQARRLNFGSQRGGGIRGIIPRCFMAGDGDRLNGIISADAAAGIGEGCVWLNGYRNASVKFI